MIKYIIFGYICLSIGTFIGIIIASILIAAKNADGEDAYKEDDVNG